MTTPPKKRFRQFFNELATSTRLPVARLNIWRSRRLLIFLEGGKLLVALHPSARPSIRPSIHLCEASALLFLINIFHLFADRRARARSSPADGGVCRSRRKWPTSKLLKLIKANKSLEMRAGRYVCGWQSSAQVLINRLEIDEWGP